MWDQRRRTCLMIFFGSILIHTMTTANPLYAPQFLPGGTSGNIRHLPCVSRRTGETGVCMFAFTCAKANGTHLGTCIDRFYFGSCCKIDDEPEISPQDNTIDDEPSSPSRPFISTQGSIESNDIPQYFSKPVIDKRPFGAHSTVLTSTISPSSFTENSTHERGTTKYITKKPMIFNTLETTTQPIRISTFQTIHSIPGHNVSTENIKNNTTSTIKKPHRPITSTVRIPLSTTTKVPSSTIVKVPQLTTTSMAIDTTEKPSSITRNTSTSTVSQSKSPSTTQQVPPTTLQFLPTTSSVSHQKPVTSTTSVPKRPSTSKKPISTTTKIPTSVNDRIILPTRFPPRNTTKFTTKKPSTGHTKKPATAIKRPSTATKRPNVSTRKPSTTPAKVTTPRSPSSSVNTKPYFTVSTTTTTITTTEAAAASTTTTNKPLESQVSISKDDKTTPMILDIVTTVKKPLDLPTTSSVIVSTTGKPIETTFNESTILTSTTTTVKSSNDTNFTNNITVIEKTTKMPPSMQLNLTTTTTTTTTLKPIPETTTQTEYTMMNETIEPFNGTSTPESTKYKPTEPTPTISSSVGSSSTFSTRTTTAATTTITTTTTTTTTTTPSTSTTTKPSSTDPSTVSTINSSSSITLNTPTSKVPIITFPDEDISLTTYAPGLVTWSSNSDETITKAPDVSPTIMIQEEQTEADWIPITTTDGWVIIQSPTTEKPHTQEEATSSKPVGVDLIEQPPTPGKPTTDTTTEEITKKPTIPTLLTTIASVTFNTELSKPDVSKPLNMSDYKQVCGNRLFPESRIVGGKSSPFGKWPWQISLRQWRTSTYLHKCGAALLNENWAITAAHCVESVAPSDLLVRVGEHDLMKEEEPYGYHERRIQIVASHPQFDARTFEYDLALLRFYEPLLPFKPNVLPICLPDDDENYVGRTAYVTGWGRLYDGDYSFYAENLDGPLPSVLQEVSVPVINNSLCEEMYKKAGYIEHIPNIFICAGWRNGGFDSCEGDSGGPMVIQRPRDKRWILAGVISWGIGCAEPNQPGVYTRISEFREWINQILQF